MSSSCGFWAWYSKRDGFKRFFCGSGNCFRKECKTLFWSRRVKLITALIEEYSLNKFFTLTLSPEYLNNGSVNAWDYIHIPWSRLRKRLKRLFPDFKFVAILEKHKNRDVPHIHGFTNIWLDGKKWSRLWDECKGGKIVWIEQVKEGASQYVNKQIEVARYVSKDTIIAPYKHRTFWRSTNTKAKFELTSSDDWCIIKEAVYNSNGTMQMSQEERSLHLWHQNEITKVKPGKSTLDLI